MWNLTPGERDAMEAIERKASKIGFNCKIRLIYLSPHEQYNPARVIAPIFGSIKQFTTLDLNAFKPDSKTKTGAYYYLTTLRKDIRRNNLIKGYRGRSGTRGHAYFLLNIEELATIWHFPNKYIKIPLLQKTAIKKAEPPAFLPSSSSLEEEGEELRENLKEQLSSSKDFEVDTDNNYFEERFAKDETIKKDIKKDNNKDKPPSNLPV